MKCNIFVIEGRITTNKRMRQFNDKREKYKGVSAILKLQL